MLQGKNISLFSGHTLIESGRVFLNMIINGTLSYVTKYMCNVWPWSLLSIHPVGAKYLDVCYQVKTARLI